VTSPRRTSAACAVASSAAHSSRCGVRSRSGATLAAAARELSLTLEAYCVLGRGKVLGQPAIQQIAERRALSEAAVILRWVMQKGVVPLVQTTKRKNAEGNLAALDFTLSEVEMNSIAPLNARNERFISGGSWAPDWNDGA